MTAGARRERPFLIAVLGAPGTGRTTLVHRLRSALASEPRLHISDGGQPALPSPGPVADLVLVTALDLPCAESCALAQAAADEELRAALARDGLGWSVISGLGDDRLTHALAAVRRALAAREPRPASRWQWHCEHCDDPACERRLLPRTAP